MPYSWPSGSIRIAKTNDDLWDQIKKDEPSSLAAMFLWVAKNPKQFCQLKELSDIRVLAINSPFAQASQQGLKEGENFGFTTAFYPGGKPKDACIPDSPKCKLCVLPHLFEKASLEITKACVCLDWTKSNPNNRWHRMELKRNEKDKDIDMNDKGQPKSKQLLIPKKGLTTIKSQAKKKSTKNSKSKTKSKSKHKARNKSKSKDKSKSKSKHQKQSKSQTKKSEKHL